MWRTGSLINKDGETGALLSGEMSGHIFFADRYFGFDDALYAAVRLLACLANRDDTLAEIRKSLPQLLHTPELRFPCLEERKFIVVDEVRSRLEKAGANVTSIDGVRVLTDDGWWLLRSSNTQDALVARCEADTPEGLTRLKAALRSSWLSVASNRLIFNLYFVGMVSDAAQKFGTHVRNGNQTPDLVPSRQPYNQSCGV